MTIVNKKCLDCGKDFEYDEKPGYPRKYCFSCSAERKKSFAEKDKVPVGKVGETEPKKDKYDNKSCYVSYAKDIFCEILKIKHSKNIYMPEEDMKKAIELVKQARSEFE